MGESGCPPGGASTTGLDRPVRSGAQSLREAKTLAERAAWDSLARRRGQLELAAINPVGVFGPDSNEETILATAESLLRLSCG